MGSQKLCLCGVDASLDGAVAGIKARQRQGGLREVRYYDHERPKSISEEPDGRRALRGRQPSKGRVCAGFVKA